MRNSVLAVLAVLACSSSSRAEVTIRPFEYRHGDSTLNGTLAFDGPAGSKRGGVLIAFDGPANGPLARQRATQYARLGYAAFVADLNIRGSDRAVTRSRAESALAAFARQPQVDAKRIAGVGYGPGGTALLELARTGADLEGVAIVHGDAPPATSADAKKISASILLIVGSDDPKFPLAKIGEFEDEMRSGGVDWQVLRFGGVAGDFTNPQAGRNLKSGAAYDTDADARAHAAIKSFLAEMLAPAANPAPPPAAKPAAPKGVPERALTVLEYVDRHRDAMPGYEGGRTFGNFERLLPVTDAQGRRIRYREWDVHPLRPGVNRGAERLVTGSDGSAHYTSDHYRSFTRIR